MDSIIYKHRPIFYFHSEEKYFPIDVEYIINSPLMYNESNVYQPLDKRQLTKSVVVHDKTNPAILYNTIKFPKIDTRYYIDFPESKIEGIKPVGDNKNGEVYAVVKEYGDYLYVYYVINYAFNYGKTVLGLQHTGDHYGDIETVIYEFDKKSSELKRVYFGAHGTEDGRWEDVSNLNFSDTSIEVYIGLGGHGNYPKPGVVYRFGGVANDKLEKGIRWEPKIVRLYLDNEPEFSINRDGWIYFGGLFGYDGVKTIFDKPWFEQNPRDLQLKSPVIIDENKFKLVNLLYVLILSTIIYFIYNYISKFKKSEQKKYYIYLSMFVLGLAGLVKYIVYRFA